MTQEEMQKAYEMLAMLHTETMAELVETRNRIDAMSHAWWPMFKHWLKVKLRMENRWD